MRPWILATLIWFCGAGLAHAADQIELKSGKTLTGRITAETEQTYTIRLGANMFLSVAKDEVSSVTRAKPAPAARPVYRMPSPVPTSGASRSAGPSASPAASASVSNPRDTTATDDLKVGRAVVHRTTRFTVYMVEGKTDDEAVSNVTDMVKGRGFPDGRRRRASRTEWTASWSGEPGMGGKSWKSVVVVATVTVSLPAWNAPAGVAASDADAWAAYVSAAKEHEAGHLNIIHDALVSFGESASNLEAASAEDLKRETTALFQAIQDQAAKRRQGYERREKNPAAKKKS